MMGKNHMIVSFAAGLAACSAVGALSENRYIGIDKVVSFFYPEFALFSYGEASAVLWTECLIFFYFLGVLFPDTDCPTSILGRYIHIPVQHRTWTHCWLSLCLLFALSYRFILFRSFTAGYALHLMEDAFSRGGIRFFYPFGRYRKWDGFYRTGTYSETIFVSISVFACLYIAWNAGIRRHGFLAFFCQISDMYKAGKVVQVSDIVSWASYIPDIFVNILNHKL